MKKIISAIIIICIIIIGFIAYKSMAKPTVKANAATLMNNSNSSNVQNSNISTGDTSASGTSTANNTGNTSSANVTTNAQSQSANTSSSSNVGSGQSTKNNNQGTATSSSTSTTIATNSNNSINTEKLTPSRIEYLNLAVPFGDPTSLLATPNTNAPIVPNSILSGVVKIKILGLASNGNYFYIDYNGIKGFLPDNIVLAFANNYQYNLNTSNIPKPNPTGTNSYTISIPNNVVINAYKTPEMNTAPILQLENTNRGTCTFLLEKFAANHSAEIFYKNQTLYVNNNYLIDYYVPQIQINDFIN